jgi:hypothetical protein
MAERFKAAVLIFVVKIFAKLSVGEVRYYA